MLGWSVPRRIGRPGVVTSTVSAARRVGRAPSRAGPCRARRGPPRSAPRTALATAPTRGRSSAGSAPIPRRTAGQAALLAEDVELERLERGDVRARRRSAASASSRSASRSRVRSARSTSFLFRRVGRGITSPRASATSRARRGSRAWPVGGQAPLASSAIRPKVAASRTARSARILRSISTSAFLRPAMNWP